MAADQHAPNEAKAHQETYGGFITLLKVGTAATLILTAIVVLLIAN